MFVINLKQLVHCHLILLAIKFGFRDNTLIGRITIACCHLVVSVTTN